jgi:pyrimidine operon attenuation protein/uracil phosphoribosyltransferase
MTSRTVFSSEDISKALRRISHEIVESLEQGEELLLLGIPTRGVELAQRLHTSILEINPAAEAELGVLDVTLYRDDQVLATRSIATTTLPAKGLDNYVVVLVDDVLYSGRTIRAALDAIVDNGRPRKVKLAVLVDRGHRELPIRADFVGKNLPTAAIERVNVCLLGTDGTDEVVIEP